MHSATNKSKSLPRSLFLGKFRLTEEEFARGLADDDIQEVVENSGRRVYSWATAEEATTNQLRKTTGVSGSKELTAKKAKVEQAAFSFTNLRLFNKSSSARAITAGPGKNLPALEDVKEGLTPDQWTTAQEHLNSAMAAFDKLLKTAKKHMQTINYDKEDSIYGSLQLVCI